MQLSEIKLLEIMRIVRDKYEKIGRSERFAHILGVAELINHLADKYEVNRHKAIASALIHDYFKYESVQEMKEYLNDEALCQECEECQVLYHAYCSAKALKDVFTIDDQEIYNAIKYHVFGRLEMTRLEELLLICDYAEPTRTYPSCIEVRKILLDGNLAEAIYLSTKYTIEHLKRKGLSPHPNQEKILQIYKEKLYK